MSITEGTQPAVKTWTGAWTTAQTTASFTPESGALLVALLVGDGDAVANTTATISDSLTGTWTQLALENTAATGLGGIAAVWCRDSPGSSMTVSVTGGVHTSTGGQLVVRTLIGAKATAQQNGATGVAGPAPGTIQVSVAAGTGNKIYGAAFNFDNSTAMTALGNTSVINAFSDTTNGDDWEAFKSSGDTAGTATYGYSTSVHGMIAAVEILAAPASSVTWTPPRYGQAAPLTQVPWEQRPYRSLPGALDTPANPLPPPLDTAWQADAAYWHLYGDSALRDRRAVFQQRPLVSDPSLLQPAGNADPLALNPEQSDSSDLWRVAIVPAFYDRREVPQQRAYISDPSAYPVDTAVGAGVCCQWTGPEDLSSYLAQRRLISDPSFYPPQNNLDPLLAGQDLLDSHQHQAATHYDRREVPQQRLYISDPSFYPLVPPTDPITLAWGAGGNYWHLYNRAADATDRREVPQQRLYESDPLLLTTAELENELLGGGDTARHAAWFTDRREVPWQRPLVSDPSLLSGVNADPLICLAEAFKRASVPAYYDRREVPQQRAYWSGIDVPADPVLLAWQEGLRRALEAATHYDRREVPQQRLYFPLPQPPPPFTVGTLTASTAPLGVLTGVTVAGGSGGVLTASDTRTGGPS